MDPRENRLSSSFATVLEHAPEFARALVSEWFGPPQSTDLTVEVQRRIAAGWIDVELRFGDATVSELVIWIEAKHGAGLSGEDQIEKYRAALVKERARRRILVLLAPVEFDANALDVVRVHEASDNDERTRLASWQELYAIANAWQGNAPTTSTATWLVDEFLRFLKEEGLDERPITMEDVVALNGANEAMDALAGVLRRAEAVVSQRWGPRQAPPNPRFWPDEYCRYRAARRGERVARRWGDANLQWACESAASADEETSVWAGLWSSVSGPLGRETNAAWISGLEARGFEYYPDRKDRWLGRSRPLRDLVPHGSSEQQAVDLATFVLESFEAATTPGPSR